MKDCGLIGTALLTVALFSYTPIRAHEEFVFPVLALVLLAGIIFLRAWTWTGAAFLVTLAGFYGLAVSNTMSWELEFAVFLPWMFVALYLWQDVQRAVRSIITTRFVLLLLLPLAYSAMAFSVEIVEPFSPYRGLILSAIAGASFLLGHYLIKMPALPRAVADPWAVEGEAEEERTSDTLSRRIPFGHLAGAFIGVVAAGVIVFADSRESLLSGIVVSGVLLALWLWQASRRGAAMEWPAAFTIAGQVVLCGSIYYFGEMTAHAVLVIAAVETCLLALAARQRSLPGAGIAIVLLVLAPVAGFVSLSTLQAPAGGKAVSALLLAALLFGCSRLLEWVNQQVRQEEQITKFSNARLLQPLQIWLTIAAAALGLFHLANGELLPENFITFGWGVVGALLLASGFYLKDAMVRYVAIGVFFFAIVRIFVVDLTGASIATKAIAFLGIGLLLVVAALAYGFLMMGKEGGGVSEKTKPSHSPEENEEDSKE